MSALVAQIARRRQAEALLAQTEEDDRLQLEIESARLAREARRYGYPSSASSASSSRSVSGTAPPPPQGILPASSSSSWSSIRPQHGAFAGSSTNTARSTSPTRFRPSSSAYPSPLAVNNKENPSTFSKRSTSPSKVLSPTIQAATRFFELTPAQSTRAGGREPLSPTKRSFNSSADPPRPALPVKHDVVKPASGLMAAKRSSHRSTQSFSFQPTSSSSPFQPRPKSAAITSPPSSLSSASSTKSSQSTRKRLPSFSLAATSLESTSGDRSMSPSTTASSSQAGRSTPSASSALAQAQLALYAEDTSRRPATDSGPSALGFSSRPTHRSTQSMAASPSHRSDDSPRRLPGNPKSIKDIIASLPVSTPTPSPSKPPTTTHKRASQSISYLPSSSYHPSSTSVSPKSTSTTSTSRATSSIPPVFHPSPHASFRPPPVRPVGSPSVKQLIASFPALSTASTELFQPKSHKRASQSVSYLSSGPTKPLWADQPKKDPSSSLFSKTSLNSPAKPSIGATESIPATARLRTVGATRSTPADASGTMGLPSSTSLMQLRGSGIVGRRLAQVPSETRQGSFTDKSVDNVRDGLPPLRLTSVGSSSSRSPLQRPSAPTRSVSPVKKSTDARSASPSKGDSYRPMKHLRGPALPGLAALSSPTASRPSPNALTEPTKTVPSLTCPPSTRALPPLPPSPVKAAQVGSAHEVEGRTSALPDMLRSPALAEGGHGLGFSGLSLRRPGREKDTVGGEGGKHEPVSPVKKGAIEPPPTDGQGETAERPTSTSAEQRTMPRSPVRSRKPATPVKTSFEVVAHTALESPSLATPMRPPTTTDESSPVKLTHPTRLRPKRPKKKSRPSYPPALVSPARQPLPPVTIPATGHPESPTRFAEQTEMALAKNPVRVQDGHERRRSSAASSSLGRKTTIRSPSPPPASTRQSTFGVQQDAKFQLFVDSLLQQAPPPEAPASVAISTDVFSVTSAGTYSLLPLLTTNAPPIVYETELLVIVHRSKVVETKLVESKVWCWKGKAWEGGGEARGKVQELAKRYGVEAVHCLQGREIPELMCLLGNEMVVRQGWRQYWAADDTSLFAVRQSQGSVFIDQIEVVPSAFTSRHPLILSVIGQTFLYVAPGALSQEVEVARRYAPLIAPFGFTEFGESDPVAEDAGLFWMCFGEEKERDFGAHAEHWRFRSTLTEDDLRLWKIDCKNAHSPAVPTDLATGPSAISEGISIVLCSFEVYVVVGAASRADQSNITFALQTASAVASRLSPSRPFTPPVHTIILPSKIPADLLSYFRFISENQINGTTPDHLNLLSLDQSFADLQTISWDPSRLLDDTFVPLGIAP